MAKKIDLDEVLAGLRKLRDDPDSDATLAELEGVLASRNSHAVAMAAKLTGELSLHALVPNLLAAFERFMQKPEKSDKGCHAKAEIAEALHQLDHDDPELYLRGIRHTQMEPVWGGKADSALALRGACARGLVRMQYRDVMVELSDLLADPEAPVRIDAARAIAYSGREDGAPILRLRVLAGDEDEQVISESLSALLSVAPRSSLRFAERRLYSADRVDREIAALALGSSRLPEALPLLCSWHERERDPELRSTALLAIAMLRFDEAFEFLLSLVADAPGPVARDAIAALGTYRHDDALGARVRDAALGRGDADLRSALREAFDE